MSAKIFSFSPAPSTRLPRRSDANVVAEVLPFVTSEVRALREGMQRYGEWMVAQREHNLRRKRETEP